ncbi:MAG: hypothetical protein FWH35_01150 [Treponema sp.]|nr:hypothetical protein [Treponema sp.]
MSEGRRFYQQAGRAGTIVYPFGIADVPHCGLLLLGTDRLPSAKIFFREESSRFFLEQNFAIPLEVLFMVSGN